VKQELRLVLFAEVASFQRKYFVSIIVFITIFVFVFFTLCPPLLSLPPSIRA
jgi:hypothetical protein